MMRVASKQDWEKEVPPDVPEGLRREYWERKNWGSSCGHGAWKRLLRECFKLALDPYVKVSDMSSFHTLMDDPDFWLFLLRAVAKEEKE